MSQLKGLKLNSPVYRVNLPSTGEDLQFKAFTVKEEKILMIAAESQDMTQVVDSLKSVIVNCMIGEIDVDSLAIFDLEYLFLKLRSKSVGETAKIGIKCKTCEHQNTVEVSLDDVEVHKDPEHLNIIKITEEIGLEMKYPTFDGVKDFQDDANIEDIINMVARSIKSVYTGEEVIDMSEEAHEDVVAFLEQFTSEQFQGVQIFFTTMPKVQHDVEFTCANEECPAPDNEVKLEGLADFF